MGRIMGEKVANFTGVKNYCNHVWGYPRHLVVTELGPNIFQFNFEEEKDKERALNGRPWVIDNQLLVVKPWRAGMDKDKEAFSISHLWIQVWNLPIHWLSRAAGFRIGEMFCSVKDVIIPPGGGKEGKHLKILAEVDISQPLIRGTSVKHNGELIWVEFKYEKCPDFCYKCGIIGHCDKTCQAVPMNGCNQKEGQYGAWMKAGNIMVSPLAGQRTAPKEGRGMGTKESAMKTNNKENQGENVEKQRVREQVSTKGHEEQQRPGSSGSKDNMRIDDTQRRQEVQADRNNRNDNLSAQKSDDKQISQRNRIGQCELENKGEGSTPKGEAEALKKKQNTVGENANQSSNHDGRRVIQEEGLMMIDNKENTIPYESGETNKVKQHRILPKTLRTPFKEVRSQPSKAMSGGKRKTRNVEEKEELMEVDNLESHRCKMGKFDQDKNMQTGETEASPKRPPYPK